MLQILFEVHTLLHLTSQFFIGISAEEIHVCIKFFEDLHMVGIYPYISTKYMQEALNYCLTVGR